MHLANQMNTTTTTAALLDLAANGVAFHLDRAAQCAATAAQVASTIERNGVTCRDQVDTIERHLDAAATAAADSRDCAKRVADLAAAERALYPRREIARAIAAVCKRAAADAERAERAAATANAHRADLASSLDADCRSLEDLLDLVAAIRCEARAAADHAAEASAFVRGGITAVEVASI